MRSKNVRREDIKSSERMEKKAGQKGGDMIERSHVGGWQGGDGSGEGGNGKGWAAATSAFRSDTLGEAGDSHSVNLGFVVLRLQPRGLLAGPPSFDSSV